jgi:hypothetical protein
MGWVATHLVPYCIVRGHQIGAAVAALGASVMRDAIGSYLSAFIASGAAFLITSVLV